LTMMNVMFTPSLLEGVTHDVKTLAGFQALFVLSQPSGRPFRCTLRLDPMALQHIRELLERMEEEYIERDEGYQTLIRGYLAQLVVMLSRCYGKDTLTAARGTTHSLALAEVAAKIERELSAKHSISALAAFARMSRRHFMRCFSEEYGVTPARYILYRRLETAAGLLGDPGARITDIAWTCGFTDSNYFTRQFSKRYGSSPREFRRKTSNQRMS
jgi:AraC family transcriptional regulator, L-rhamnose operon regulatory protein RhaS